jgi:hypothetical protein
VLSADGVAIDTPLPLTTVHPVNVYPTEAVAVIVVATPWDTVTGDEAGTVIVPPVVAVTVRLYVFSVKFARTVASPLVSVTVVLSADGFAIDTPVPLTTVHPVNVYPTEAVAVIVVATPWDTVTGDEAGTMIVPPVVAVTVRLYPFNTKFACIVALPFVSVAVVLNADGAAIDTPVPFTTVHPINVYPTEAVAAIVVATPWDTVTGDDAGTVIDPPVVAVTVRLYVFNTKFACIVALPFVSVAVVLNADGAAIKTPLPLTTVHPMNV